MDRRKFLKQTGLLVGSAGLSTIFACGQNAHTVGVQLWGIRNALNTDFEATIARVAELGYTHVESAGYNKKDHTIYSKSAKAFAKAVKLQGLNPFSAHAAFTKEEADAVLDDFATVGVEYLVWPSVRGELRKDIDGYRRAADELNAIGEQANARGIRFGYHNHDFEFVDMHGEVPYDTLLENTDSDLVFFEMDLGWLVKAGFQPVDYFKRYRGRFPLWHIRDINDEGQSVPVGSGKLDFQSIYSQTKLAGYQLGMVETQANEALPMQPIEQSIHFLKTNKLV